MIKQEGAPIERGSVMIKLGKVSKSTKGSSGAYWEWNGYRGDIP